MAADSPSAPAPAVDVLKELQDAVAEAKDEAALESVGSTFAPILQGKLSPEEEAFVEKLFMDRIGVLSGPKTVAKEEAWDAAAASKDILAAVAEAKDGSQLADVMHAITEGRTAIVKAGRGDLDMEITKAIEAKSASFAPKPAQAAPAAPDAGASPDAVLKLYDEYKPRDPSRLESWRKIVLEMAAAKTKADVETAYAPHRQTVTAWGDDSGNLAAIRFMIRKNLPE